MKVIDINQYRKKKKSPRESLMKRNAKLRIERIFSQMKKTDKEPWKIPHRGY